MKIDNQEKAARVVVDQLINNGFDAYYCGGCVRDLLLGVQPKDYDVATDAKPEVVQSLFKKTLDLGKRFGTITVLFEEAKIEVTTFRKDSTYLDGRHPTSVEFSDIKEDASRRDFTVNAMYLSPSTGQILDFFKGKDDLEAKLIRCVGRPEERFQEDHLRLLRALRFSVQLSFAIEENTLNAIVRLGVLINKVAVERVVAELSRMFQANVLTSFKVLYKSNVLNQLFAFLNLNNEKEWQEFLNLSKNWYLNDIRGALTLMALWSKLKGAADSSFKEKIKFLKLSKEDLVFAEKIIDKVIKLEAEKDVIERVLLLEDVNSPYILEAWKVKRLFENNNFSLIDQTTSMYLQLCGNLKTLPQELIDGNDIKEHLGLQEGIKIKQLLHVARRIQLQQNIKEKSQLLEKLKNY